MSARALDWTSTLGRDDRDLDLVIGRSQTRALHGRARRRGSSAPPALPDAVHFRKARHVDEPDGGAQNVALIGIRVRQQPFDPAEDVLGLFGNTAVSGSGSHLSRE